MCTIIQRTLFLWGFALSLGMLAYHPLRYVRFINPLKEDIWVNLGTERGIFGADKVKYRFKIPAKGHERISVKHALLTRMTNSMQSPRPFFERDLPQGSYVHSLEVQYGPGGSGAKKIVADDDNVRALNRCMELLKNNAFRQEKSGIQFLEPKNPLSVPFACMISGKPTYEFGVTNPAEMDINVLDDSAENPDPFQHYIPSESEIGRPPRKTDPQRHIYQQDSQIDEDIQDLPEQ